MNRAPHYLLIDCPGAGRALVFGLRWHALIGSDVTALARSRGRRLRATHYVVAGSPVTVAGYGRTAAHRMLSWRRAGTRRVAPRLLAAAQLFALRYPAGGHSLVCLPDGRYWLVAAHAGVVLSQTDRLFESREDALREQARLLIARPDLSERDADEVYAALQAAGDPAAQLIALPSHWKALPRVLRWFLICLALSIAGPALWSKIAVPPPPTEPALAGPATGPEAQAQARRILLSAIPAHGPAELGRVLAGLVNAPLEVQGWALRRAQCDAQTERWLCQAVYARVHRQATNQGLYARLPRGWQVSFNPLEEASLSWQVASQTRSLVDVALPTPLQVDLGVAATLQQLRPAFVSIVLAPAVLALPTAVAAGAAADPAVLTPDVRARSLVLNGPLRSFTLLPGRLGVARWSRLAVYIQPQLRSSLVASTLVAELQGVIYEQH
ncbi:type 4b pilus protein PilO2 [Achromobacter sp. UMC71]|uniref:type 4b pilus protein PilO2 n=1 Tax=Achromobacter sp. UMC71 TaxID=1862320 RepID=UPI001603BBAA|nr:type 4b pilus protein PilO2 [Achromobacter sp. UMC71]